VTLPQARDSYHTVMRPGTHEMLAAVHGEYDIMFWSQTNWNWVELKLTEMGILQVHIVCVTLRYRF
jgi:hypothetical protein